MGRHRSTIVKRIPVKVRRRLTKTNRPFPVEDGLTATGPRFTIREFGNYTGCRHGAAWRHQWRKS